MVNRSLRADPEAERFADEMLAAERTMRVILEETVTPQDGQILESGRTACGDMADVRGPLGRFPRSVDLRSCPWGLSGTWHSHVTTAQILNPEHSLPDMANVFMEGIDASIVVGAEKSDVLVSAANNDAALERFQNVLGIEATSTEDLVFALDDGTISDPTRARERVRTEMAPLFRRVRTPHGDIAQQAQQITASEGITMGSPLDAITAVEPLYADFYGLFQSNGHGHEDEWEKMHGHTPDHPPGPQRMRNQSRKVNGRISSKTDGITNRVVDQAAGVVISDLTRKALGSLI